jgi:hypothetical protein
MLILHLNTKYCRASTDQGHPLLAVSIGKKDYQALNQAYRVNFAYQVTSTTPDYFNVGLGSKTGPLGTRGAVERNTMRYHLAIKAYLDALPVAPAEQFEKRLQNWFTATESYSRQLHEMDRATYLDMKRREYQRQQITP